MLDRVSGEDFDEHESIESTKKEVQNQFFMSCKDIAEKIAKNELSFEEVILNKNINFNSANISLFFEYISNDLKNKLALKIYDYIDKNQYLLKNNFFQFLTTRKSKPIDSLNSYIRHNLQMPKDKEYIQNYKKLISRLKSQERMYKRSDLYSTYIIGGQEYKIDDNIIDQAYAYANDNDYHISYPSMNFLCKQIATGKLIYSKETGQQKDEMINNIITLIKEERTIEDYIDAMKEQSAVRK